jgi:hypothetical protein
MLLLPLLLLPFPRLSAVALLPVLASVQLPAAVAARRINPSIQKQKAI